MQQCSVVSRCGRFEVSAAANRTKDVAAERVRYTVAERTPPGSPQQTFFVALSDQALQQCAANSGFRPEVPMLVKMMFSALAGASSTASFTVVTQADDAGLIKKYSAPAAAAGSVIVLLFQLKGDFAESAVVASLGIPLQRMAAGAAPPAPALQQPAVAAAAHQQGTAAAAAPPQQQQFTAIAPAPAAAAPPASGPAAPTQNDDVVALTRILKETQQFLYQQREETAQRFERINAELKHRAAECSSLRRDVDILKSSVGRNNRATAVTSSSGGGGNRFQSPGNSRPGSAYRQQQQQQPSHYRSSSTGSNGGGGRGPPYRRTMTPPRSGSAGNQQQRRFDSPNRPPGTLVHRPAFGSSSARGSAPPTPNRSSNSNTFNRFSSSGNDGSRGSVGSDRMYFGRMKLPGRKALDDVCKLELLQAAKPEEVMNLWLGHHAQFSQYWGRVMSTAAYNAMRPRLDKSRYFVVPIFRDKGIYNCVTNFNDDIVGVTPLVEWQNKGDHAQAHMLIQFFTELSDSKDLVLVRCELQDKHMSRQDCALVTMLLMKFYTMPNLYEQYVETFNKRPNNFDFHAYLRCIKEEVGGKGDSIKIEDKKSELRGDAYSSLGKPGAATAGGVVSAVPQAAPSTAAGISVPTKTQQEALQRSHEKVKKRE